MAASLRLISSIFSILLLLLFAAATTAAMADKEKTTKFHLYFHDIATGKNPSLIQVIKVNGTSPLSFGNALVLDDPITAGPNLSSKLIGRSQGTVWSVSQKETVLFFNLNVVFSTGKYNGSTIALLGAFQSLKPVRELPVVGGTGLFRFARGYALSTTYSQDANTGNAIFKWNITIFHY